MKSKGKNKRSNDKNAARKQAYYERLSRGENFPPLNVDSELLGDSSCDDDDEPNPFKEHGLKDFPISNDDKEEPKSFYAKDDDEDPANRNAAGFWITLIICNLILIASVFPVFKTYSEINAVEFDIEIQEKLFQERSAQLKEREIARQTDIQRSLGRAEEKFNTLIEKRDGLSRQEGQLKEKLDRRITRRNTLKNRLDSLEAEWKKMP